MNNCLTDVGGLKVGNVHDPALMSGVTAIVFDVPAAASVAILGGAPAGRDLGCLEPDAAVQDVDAIVLSGGSGFGLDAASGAQAWLREQGRGLAVGPARVPIVPSAICFDLNNGGDKSWGRYPPYRELGHAACANAAATPVELGTIGAGYGASTVDLKGGLGCASAITASGAVVAALVVVNALGSALLGQGPHFWAWALERDDEFGGLSPPARRPSADSFNWKGRGAGPFPSTATTLACIATDATLDKSALKRLSLAAGAGLAKGLRLSHAPMDGDTIFAASTRRKPSLKSPNEATEITVLAADCLARAIARGVHAASIPPTSGLGKWAGPPSWKDRIGGAQVG